ncbi:hypothetical protein C7H19_18175 [Aphanothece hegewaldii CCALA 016]|uniref:Uncharacterized protein n=1 Tax=Aphanothece hegewaldii CCALA 016 TaxID=2107694 RepID=A0A2T1LU63_9CHRO|nr:hypothetical protein [Aphanothece hegewaldii]PSF34934.1 hypothetical protein C7H19_18175 [Aphanothece hegewaldii CCALA 016]
MITLIYSIPINFVKLIRTIATAYHLDFDGDYLSLRLDHDHSDDILLIEKLDQYRGVVSSFKTEQGLEKPIISLEFLIEQYDNYSTEEEDFYPESWIPLSLTSDRQDSRLIASVDQDGKLTAYDDVAMKEASDLCIDWWRELEKQGWHDNGKPAADVTATVRYAKYQTIAQKLSDAPVIEFDSEYRIKANRLGLYVLVNSITSVLTEKSGNGHENNAKLTVFDLQAEVHQLQVEILNQFG